MYNTTINKASFHFHFLVPLNVFRMLCRHAPTAQLCSGAFSAGFSLLCVTLRLAAFRCVTELCVKAEVNQAAHAV